MIGNLLRAVLFHGLLAAATGIGATANAQTLALVGGKVYASPDAAPLDDAVIVTVNGVITAIGSRSDVQVPSDARVIDCTGKTVVAGFWNSHVHFTEAVWRDAGNAPAAPLTAHMQEMLTRWGFTSVWSLGSDPGELAGAAPPRQCGRNPRSKFSSSAAFSPGTAVLSICQPTRSFPRLPRRSGRRRWRGTTCRSASTASSCSPAPTREKTSPL